MLLLNRHEVEALLDVDRLIESLALPMADLSAGAVSMPQRIAVMVGDQGGLLANMPVYVSSAKTLATKILTVYPRNASLGIPTHQALIMAFDPATGTPSALMDGTYITAIRTAAGSALATKLLARPDADVLVIVGTGVQARAHGRAIPRVHSLREVRVVGRNEERASRLAEELLAELEIPVIPVASFRQAVSGAGIICATTHSAQPVVIGSWLEPGVHVNSVGLNLQGRELDDDTIMKSLIVVESRQAALFPGPGGANDLTWPIRDGLITEDHIHAEVGELVSGTKEGRTSPAQITLYKSVGVAVQDAVAAQIVLEAAHDQGVGIEFEV
jgi:alanine dehydrogenase